jgi:rare lipoprotein A
VVRVTNAENGRQVVVVINDRGPYLRGRVMDLSYTAADELGAIKEGTIPILIEVTMRRNRGPTSPLVRIAELKPESGFAAVRCPWVTEAEDLQVDSEKTSNIERLPGRVTRGPTDLPPLNRSRLGNRRGSSGRIGSYDE